MAKKKKKRRRSASSVMSLISGDAEAPPLPEPPLPEPPPLPTPKVRTDGEWRRKDTCGVCGKAKQPIAITDCDDAWEDADHPDHIFREVCVRCVADYYSREECVVLVFDAMRHKLRQKDFTDKEVEQAVHIAWRTFGVEFDHKELVKMARNLKVKHPWLTGKRSK